jgi:hypothetical protein
VGVPRPNNDALGDACVRYMCDDAGWIKRRKELCTVLTDRTIHHQISIDLEVPDGDVLVTDDEGRSVDWLPLFVLRKAPKRMTRFDFRDESRTALPLPTRAENAEVSVAAVQRLAAKTLLASSQGATVLAPDLLADLDEIARADARTGRRLVAQRFAEPPSDREASNDRERLVRNRDFKWCLDLVAEHSIVMVPFVGARGERRIVKVSYDEKIAYPPRGWLPDWYEKFGWRGYLLTLDHPFIGAANYHFELDAPDDMQITDAGLITGGTQPLDAATGVRKRVHFYAPEAEKRRGALSFAQLRVRGRSFTGGAVLIAALIALLLSGGYCEAEHLAKGSSGAPSLLLVFPGLVAAYIAREEHPLVTRLLAFARRLLLLSAGLAILAAARLVIVTKEQPASHHTLEVQFGIAAIVAWAIVLGLLLTRQLPLKLTSRLRRKTRLQIT